MNKIAEVLTTNRKLMFCTFIVLLGFVIFLMIFSTYWYGLTHIDENPKLAKEFDLSFDSLIDLFYAFIALVGAMATIFTGGNYGEHVEKRKVKEATVLANGNGHGSDTAPEPEP